MTSAARCSATTGGTAPRSTRTRPASPRLEVVLECGQPGDEERESDGGDGDPSPPLRALMPAGAVHRAIAVPGAASGRCAPHASIHRINSFALPRRGKCVKAEFNGLLTFASTGRGAFLSWRKKKLRTPREHVLVGPSLELKWPSTCGALQFGRARPPWLGRADAYIGSASAAASARESGNLGVRTASS